MHCSPSITSCLKQLFISRAFRQSLSNSCFAQIFLSHICVLSEIPLPLKTCVFKDISIIDCWRDALYLWSNMWEIFDKHWTFCCAVLWVWVWEVVCPKIATCTSKNEANNSGVDRELCICLFSDCYAAAHSETDQPGERREAGKARGDIKHNTFL